LLKTKLTSGFFFGKKMQIINIIHHNDLDGATSAALIKFYLLQIQKKDVELKFHSISYGHALPNIKEDDIVYMVDFCMQPFSEMLAIYNKFKNNFIWFDHHLSVMANEPNDICGCRKTKNDTHLIAACEVIWDALFPEVKKPNLIEAIGEWDTWRHKDNPDSLGPDIKLFFDTLTIQETIDYVYDYLIANVLEDYDYYDEQNSALELARQGERFKKFVEKQSSELMGVRGFEGLFSSIPAIITNSWQRGSMSFKSMYDKNKHDVMVGFAMENNGYWTVSIYSEKEHIDCGALAKRLGEAGPIKSGGGHKGAAGFQCTWQYLNGLIEKKNL
jgi:single-stranded DNA-specific DHH superfamily exonuclease